MYSEILGDLSAGSLVPHAHAAGGCVTGGSEGCVGRDDGELGMEHEQVEGRQDSDRYDPTYDCMPLSGGLLHRTGVRLLLSPHEVPKAC